MRGLARAALGLVAAAVLAAALPAAAAEATRASYREAVEPICKANTEANQRIFKGVRAAVRHGKLRPAARRFSRAGKALKRALGELKAVPEPSADRSRLGRWFSHLGAEASLLQRTARELAGGRKSAAEALVIRLEHEASLANGVSAPFEFRYCRLEPSRFT